MVPIQALEPEMHSDALGSNTFLGDDPGHERSLPAAATRRQAAPRATQAFAETTNGGSGSFSLQSSRNDVRRSGSRPATCAPDGATPSVNGSHQSSNVACSTSTATALSTMSPIPAARKRSARWPDLLPGQTDPVSTSGSSSRAAAQNGPSGPPSVKSHTHAATTPPSRVTRAISQSPASGSSMTLTTS